MWRNIIFQEKILLQKETPDFAEEEFLEDPEM